MSDRTDNESDWSGVFNWFHTDERATTITEFVVTLPVMIVIFVGIVELGKLSRKSVNTWTSAHIRAFDRSLALQEVGVDQLLDGNMNNTSNNSGSGVCAAADVSASRVLTPESGASVAAQHLDKYPAYGSASALITAEEGLAYSKLGLKGTTGLIFARTIPFAESFGTSPVTKAVMQGEKIDQFVGSGAGSSAYARSLFKDNTNLGSSSGCAGSGNSPVSSLNTALSSTGSRPMLAAGQLYGTCVGCAEQEITMPTGDTVDSVAYMTMTMPARRGNPSIQPYYTTLVSRLAMEDCRQTPYWKLLGVDYNDPVYPDQIGEDKLDKIPVPKESTSNSSNPSSGGPAAGFAPPLDYGTDNQNSQNNSQTQ